MSDSREESPDWLRSFQPPTRSTIELSSESDSPLDRSPLSDDEDGINLSKLFKKEATQISPKGKSPKKNEKVKKTPDRKRKRKNEDDSKTAGKRAKGNDSSRPNRLEKHDEPNGANHSIWSLSSDSESSPNGKPGKKDKVMKTELSENEEDLVTELKNETGDIHPDDDEKPPQNQPSKVKSPLKELENKDNKSLIKKDTSSRVNEETVINDKSEKVDNSNKHHGLQASSSRLPLLLSDKVQRSKALVECEGDSIDLSGDVGSVGRIVISEDPTKNHEMSLDLKGTIYKATIVPSRTFCVVSFGQAEAKIEAIMNDYIQLKPQSNVYEAETMVEGTLDGFSFDSEDEADKRTAQPDQNEAENEQPDGKTKRKSEKTAGAARKKGKPAGGKTLKKVKKKPQVSRKSKAKK